MSGREERERGRVTEHGFKGGIQQQKTVRKVNSLAGRAMAIQGADGETTRRPVAALSVWTTK
jgi:hypothetical protein